jgi:hypothetical protein
LLKDVTFLLPILNQLNQKIYYQNKGAVIGAGIYRSMLECSRLKYSFIAKNFNNSLYLFGKFIIIEQGG